MIVLFRIKDNEKTLGYMLKDDNNNKKLIKLNETDLYKPTNVKRLKSGEYIGKSGNHIKSIDKNKLKLKISSRHTSEIGKPSLIQHSIYGKLSGTQKRILDALKDTNKCIFNRQKDNISIDMNDLSALTAYTGLEYSLFKRNDTYVIMRGTKTGMIVTYDESKKLIDGMYKWVGHTHPGTTINCLMPSKHDYDTLSSFNQKQSVIYNSVGQFSTFGLEVQS